MVYFKSELANGFQNDTALLGQDLSQRYECINFTRKDNIQNILSLCKRFPVSNNVPDITAIRHVVGQDRCGTVFYHIHSNFLWKKLLLVIYLYIKGSNFLN